MKKNVAAQIISAVVVSATDGSAITTGVSVTVTGDGGTQGAGGGTVTHEGGGEWSYVPTQAETNFDHIVFKFSGTGAVPVGIQVYTSFPQTGDSFARIGVAGAGLTAIDLPDQTMNITGNLSGSVGSVTGAVGSVTGAVGSVTGLTAATVHADLDDIQARLPAALTADGNIKADTLRVNGSALAAARMARAGASMVLGTCAAGGTTTSVVASALAPTSAVNSQFNGRIIIFADDTTTTALRGQATDITAYTHATLTFTVTALTTAPASGDVFTIV